MSDKIRKLKENAARLLAKGKLGDAAEEYKKVVKADPRDLMARQKLAEVYARMGQIKDAVREYQSVAGSYAADGLLLKAIAICKVILSVDPAHNETQHVLADLYARRRGDGAQIEMPKAMSAALAKPGKRSASEIRGMPESLLPTSRTPVAARAAPEPTAPPVDARDVEIDLGSDDVEVVSIEAAASDRGAMLGAPIQTNIADLITVRGDPTGGFDIPMTTDPGSEAIDVPLGSLDSQPPVILGTTLSEEGATLPPDESLFVEGEEVEDGEVLEVYEAEPAKIDVDAMPPMPLFSDLPREAFIALTERMDLRTYVPGEVVVAEGDPGQSMFIVIQGRLRVVRVGEGGVEVPLAELGDGAFFGEMALLSDAPRSATVMAEDEVMLFEISRELLSEITREYPQVSEVMKRFHRNRLLTNLLKTSPIFVPFTANDKKALIEKFKSRTIPEGAYIITRERPGDGLYVVLQGRCEVLDVDEQGREVLLAELKEGDVFGEMSMLWHKETCASIRASTPAVVLRMPKASFNEVIMTHPQILETLTNLSERRQKQNAELLDKGSVLRDYLV